jgi:hypothetical protein
MPGGMFLTCLFIGGVVMNEMNNDLKKNSLKININDKMVTLKFTSEPNIGVADFVKKTLINAFLIKETK